MRITSDLHEALGHAVSDKRLEVLRRVGQTGSISQAARDVGISYKAAWQAIDTLTQLSGEALVDKTVGGSGGGGARLTAQGQRLLEIADALAQARAQVLARFGQSPGALPPLGLRTSMRNQLPCRIGRVEALPGAWVVSVALELGAGQVLAATLTRESADLLGLEPGLPVLALCKATAVKVQAPNPFQALAGGAGGCVLQGTVQQVTAGDGLDEVVLALDSGGHWVGCARHGEVQAQQPAEAHFPASAVVLARSD